MILKGEFMKDTVRPIAIAVVAIGLGSILVLLLENFFNLEFTKISSSAITFIIAAFTALYIFPRIVRLPFGDADLSEYLRRLGFYLPHQAWKHILLGSLLAVCTLLGMLIGSLLTGRYEFDWSTVSISHTLFSINPGVWEEFFYRGIIMFVLLKTTNSLKRAAVIQIILFGLSHIKGFHAWWWVDVISVMVIAIAFTYTAYRTRTLLAGIVFHFLHDVFLFLPQLPGAEYIGFSENLAFFGSLWVMVGVGCVIVKLFVDNLAVKAGAELYTLE